MCSSPIQSAAWPGRLGLFSLLLLHLGRLAGACEFPKEWTGGWFQSGVPTLLHINATFIETKGECHQEQGEKVVVYDKSDSCYRCMAIHVKHPSVLQYKETDCVRVSPQEICAGISGDAPLYSMFRKYPEAKPIPCPFKSAPFTFSYNRGTGDCSFPVSKAESCTDDSRLVLKYQACPDVSSESHVEELICLATWKEGSTRYLVGRISQGNRRTLTLDEDQYRCFIYQRDVEANKVVYNIAQSADATCNGLQSAFEGSKTMKFKTVDNHHNRCKFPTWITEHHTWLSLDHRKTFKFSQRNATLKIVDEEPKPLPNYAASDFVWNREFGMESQEQRKQNLEMRLICHGILQQSPEQKKTQMVQIVAHMTHDCISGYICMVFYKRDNKVIEIQQSIQYQENPDDACRYFDAATTPFTTLITTTLKPKKCPHLGRYSLASNALSTEKRKKRQQPSLDQSPTATPPECESHEYESLSVGCNPSQEQMEFKTPCIDHPTVEYTCHGNWVENDTHYVITSPISRKSADNTRYCLVYTLNGPNHQSGGGSPSSEGGGGGVTSRNGASGGPNLLRLSGVLGNCNRDVVPGVKGNWAFNFTSQGSCDERAGANGSASHLVTSAAAIFASAILLVALLVLR